MEKAYREEMERNIDILLRDKKLSEKTVFVFGHCNASEDMICYLEDNGVNVAAILDNNKSKQGSSYKSIIINAPMIICDHKNKNCIVLVAAKAYESMANQLRETGYCGEILKVVDYNSFEAHSLSDDIFKDKKSRVLRGVKILDKIRRKYVQEHLVICPYNAIGDVYQALSFLPEYCKKNNINKTAVLVTGNACKQVAELFEVNNFLVLGRVEMDELVQAIIFLREKNCIIAHHDRPYTNDIIKYLNKHFLSFIDFYRCGVFGIGKDAVPAIPSKKMAFDNIYNIKKGEALILSPYAKSMVKIPSEYWDRVIKENIEKGFQVYTNVAGEEQPLEGTKPLNIPINQMVSAAEYAGNFIGIRSGLCDILNTARCRKTVVFPDCYYSTTNVKVHEFFRMPGWEQIVSQV